MQIQTIDFIKIVKRIEDRKIILPDFQREFVWRDENMQKQIVASVFAQMPIGSILLLKSKPDEFASKNIGSKIETDKSLLGEEVDFLLDGQQRLTVLTNVFSDIIFEQCNKLANLISPSLKRRFFLKIPKWKDLYDNQNYNDILGIKTFSSPQDDYGNVSFLTSDIVPYIEIKTFVANDNNVYNPTHPLDNMLDSFCVSDRDCYLIPLYIFISTSKNAQQSSIRKRNIIAGIGNKIVDEIIDQCTLLSSSNQLCEVTVLLSSILDDDSVNLILARLKSDQQSAWKLLKNYLLDKSLFWTTQLESYINSCLTKMALTEIEVTSEQRARAIDIYENLNRGGISLSTFDLIMARVAIVSKDNFYKRIVNNINSIRKYNLNLIPTGIANIFAKKYTNGGYIASVSTDCYSAENNKIDKLYIDAFLNVLSLYCNNESYDCNKYSLDFIKRYKILQLSPQKIDDNCEKICIALDRALFFLQARCGLRSIRDINYNLMLVFIATVFTNDSYYNDVSIHKKLEAWYWSSVFSGEFDKDQNSVLIKHLKLFFEMISKQGSDAWIKSMNNEVLNTNNFSDERLLLLEKIAEDRYPKKILRKYISQYFLSKTYPDMFNQNDIVSVFADCSSELELHHIIPLGSVVKISESSNKLRNDKNHICNSPLNFVFITKTANLNISAKSLDDYAKLININAKSALMITQYFDANSVANDDKIKNVLKFRYDFIKGDIQNHVLSLL